MQGLDWGASLMVAKGRLHRLLAGETGDDSPLQRTWLGSEFVFCRARLQLLEPQLELVEQLAAALGRGSEALAPQFGDDSLRCATTASASWRAWRLATSAALGASTPSGRMSVVIGTDAIQPRSLATVMSSRNG